MAQLLWKTKGGEQPQGKPRVYFTCYPSDFEKTFESITNDLFSVTDCAVFYTRDLSVGFSEEEYNVELKNMNLFVIPVTLRLLTEDNRAMLKDYAYAREEHIPVLPIMIDHGIDKLYSHPDRFNDLQYLDPEGNDNTGVSYKEKLKNYLQSVLVDDETANRIRAAFDAYVFLSYRKKDRKHADELMRLIHNDPVCRDIAIWYDEYLVPGESFNEVIEQAMKKSELFTLLVTPNLINEDNYVRNIEYPEAVKSNKKILPIEMVPTDKEELFNQYEGLNECFDVKNDDEFDRGILGAIRELALQNKDDPVHNYLMGLAYLDGIDVEVNRERAIELITSAGDANLLEAVNKLYKMYSKGIGIKLDYNKALYWAEKRYEITRREKGENHPSTLKSLNILAISYGEVGNYKKALEINKQVYLLRKEVLGENHPDTIISLNNLAGSYRHIGNYEKSLEIDKQAYSLRKEVLGENHPDTIRSLSNLAGSYSKIGNYAKALEMNEQAYSICKEVLGENHPDTIRSVNNLAGSYYKIGNYEKSLELMEKTYSFTKEVFGETHPNTIKSLNNLAMSYSKIGNYAKTLELLEKANSLQKEVLGENHPDTIRSLNNLAVSYSDIGNYEKSLELLEKAYSLRKEVLGENHPDTIRSLNNLAVSYSDIGNYAKTLELLEKAYSLRKEVLGENHPDTISLLYDIARIYDHMEDSEKSLELMEKA